MRHVLLMRSSKSVTSVKGKEYRPKTGRTLPLLRKHDGTFPTPGKGVDFFSAAPQHDVDAQNALSTQRELNGAKGEKHASHVETTSIYPHPADDYLLVDRCFCPGQTSSAAASSSRALHARAPAGAFNRRSSSSGGKRRSSSPPHGLHSRHGVKFLADQSRHPERYELRLDDPG